MSNLNLNVVAGRSREIVGTIPASVGITTNQGRISRMTEKTIFVVGKDGDEKSYRKTDELTVRHADAMRAGYPDADGCNRQVVRYIKRGAETVEA